MNGLQFLPTSLAIAVVLIAGAPASAQTIVPTRPFDAIELEGGGHVLLRHGNVQQVRLIEGSTTFTRFRVEDTKLRIEACNDECPNHYDLEVEITTPAVEALAISGGGAIETEGGFPGTHRLTVAVHGGGRIDARSMTSAEATAAVEGGGRILVNADRRLTAVVHGGGTIRYWGNPSLTQVVEGGGSIKQGD